MNSNSKQFCEKNFKYSPILKYLNLVLRCPELLLSSLLVLKWSLMLPIDLGTWNFSCSERNAKEILSGRKLIWNWSLWTAVGFRYFRILKRRTALNTFISLGSCRLDYSFLLLTTAHSWKYSWELERSFAVFQEEHGPNWQSWPTSCTNFNVGSWEFNKKY